jgi:hypothetical protein
MLKAFDRGARIGYSLFKKHQQKQKQKQKKKKNRMGVKMPQMK